MWVGVALASLVVLIILILSIPLDGVLSVDVYGGLKFRLRFAWLFGLISREVKEGQEKAREKKRVPEGKPKNAKRMRSAELFKIMRTKGLPKQFITLLKDILRRLRIRKLEADLTVGFDNPADTGVLFALIGPAILFLRTRIPHQIRVKPSFDAVCQGYFRGTVRLQPIQLVPPLLRFTLSLPTARAIKTLVLVKLKGSK